jgi:2-phospho-L-lactate guanylyltransferase
MEQHGVLIPIKAFDSAKARLASVLNSTERADLARSLAEGVIKACVNVQVWVICEDDNVEDWALSLGVQVIRNPEEGLNKAAQIGLSTVADLGVEKVLITHGDLINPAALTSLLEKPGIVLVPDRHLTGTNVIGLPAHLNFSFSYGSGSFSRHVKESERFDLPLTIMNDSVLGFDVDNPDDLTEYRLSK